MKKTAILAAKEAGKILMKNFRKKVKVNVKANKSFVSEIDIKCEKMILSILRKKFPDHNYITEESSPIDSGSEYTWHIDPLDGTHNYLHGLPLFGVSIGLQKKGEEILGVIYLPCFDELYIAEKGKGAFCNGKKIKVSNQDKLNKAMFFFGDVANKDVLKKPFKKLYESVGDVRIIGSAVNHLTSVAKGNGEAYITNYTNSWDVAAGHLLVKEAGGRVSNWKGKEAKADSCEFLVSNGKLHKKLVNILNKY